MSVSRTGRESDIRERLAFEDQSLSRVHFHIYTQHVSLFPSSFCCARYTRSIHRQCDDSRESCNIFSSPNQLRHHPCGTSATDPNLHPTSSLPRSVRNPDLLLQRRRLREPRPPLQRPDPRNTSFSRAPSLLYRSPPNPARRHPPKFHVAQEHSRHHGARA